MSVEVERDLARARALPYLTSGDPAPVPDPEPGLTGFRAIVRVFLRTWPYLLPHAIGRWHEIHIRGGGSTQYNATDASTNDSSTDWSFRHVPPIVTLLAILGPLFDLVNPIEDWTHSLVFSGVLFMTLTTWILLFAKGRPYVVASLLLGAVAGLTFLFAMFAETGLGDNLYVGIVSIGCVGIWVFQYRFDDGKLRLRLRIASHLIYYFVLLWASTLLGLVIALFSVDLISQSILQAKPLTPFMADFIGQPDMAITAVQSELGAESNVDLQTLTDEQRHSLKWVYAAFTVIGWLVQVPTMLFLPYYYIFIMQRVNQDLRMALVQRWHRLSIRYHSDHRVGDSVYRVYQDSAQVTAVIGTVTQVVQLAIAYVTGVVLLTALDPILGLSSLSILVFALLWGLWYSPRMRVKSLASRIANSEFTSKVQETLAAIRHIKANGTEDSELDAVERDSVRAFNASFRVRSLVAVVGIITFSLAAGVLLLGQFLMAIWAFGEREVFAAVLIGLVGLSFLKWNLSAYQSAQEQLGGASVSVRDLVELWTQAQDMAMGLNRVFDILDIEPDVQDHPNAQPMQTFKQEICFDRVKFGYTSDRQVLADINLIVQPSTIVAIVGPTGSGKSTLVSLLFRLFDPDSGAITIDGVDLRDLQVDTLRRNLSVALQENVLFGVSIRDNIRYVVPEATDEQVQAAARVACVARDIERLPEGYDTVLSDRGGKLSTGQRQRVSIARAILKDAQILILDEPTAALDPETESQVLQQLSHWGEGRAIFLITHRISTIRQADRIVYLDQGVVAEYGTHEELMALESGRYREFVETEADLAKQGTSLADTGEIA